MKSFKMNGLSRLFSFVLIAVILVCTVGFAVGGLQSNKAPDPNNSGDIGSNTENTDEDTDQSKEPDENPSNQNQDNLENELPKEPAPEHTKYYNTITGILSNETSKFSLSIVNAYGCNILTSRYLSTCCLKNG